jgi:hypothetical protein
MSAKNKIAAVGATLAAGAAVTGAAVESLPMLVVAAGLGIAATSIKLIEHHQQEEQQARGRTQPIRRAAATR